MAEFITQADEIVCHCLRITKAEVTTAIETTNATSVRSIMKDTEAGTGCTACQCRIKQLIAAHRARAVSPIEDLAMH